MILSAQFWVNSRSDLETEEQGKRAFPAPSPLPTEDNHKKGVRTIWLMKGY